MAERLSIVFLTGAGISAESGIPTFRSGDKALWKNIDSQTYCTAAALNENPQRVLDFYNQRRLTVYNAQPNHAHQVIANLQNTFDVHIITQNVDNLHERAGSNHIIHVHGKLTEVTSSSNRTDISQICNYPLNIPIHVGDKAPDGSQLRPNVVMMDECLPSLDESKRLIRDADVFVIIGTSLTIGAGAILYNMSHPYIPKFIIDPQDYTAKLSSDFKWIPTTACEGIDIFVKLLKKL